MPHFLYSFIFQIKTTWKCIHLTSSRMAILNNITIMAIENDQRRTPLYRYGWEGSLFTLQVGMPISADNVDISVEDYQKPKSWFTLWPTWYLFCIYRQQTERLRYRISHAHQEMNSYVSIFFKCTGSCYTLLTKNFCGNMALLSWTHLNKIWLWKNKSILNVTSLWRWLWSFWNTKTFSSE